MCAGQLMFEGMPGLSATEVKWPSEGHGAPPKARRRLPSPVRAVLAFHRAFGLPVRERPTGHVPVEERDLRVRLIQEEADEFTAAAADGDVVAIADALADIVYVTYGTALHYGIDLDAALAEIHRSNMSKLGPGGRAVVRSDGKVLKGPSYEAPDLARALGVSDQDTGLTE